MTDVDVPKRARDGGYFWKVNTRDSNEHILLGDFGMGSMSKRFYFSVGEE